MTETADAEHIDQIKAQFPKFYAAVFDDGVWLKKQLNISALYLMSFELFQDFVESRFRFFFSNKMKLNKKGEFVDVPGTEFEEAKAKYSIGKSTLFEASCNWLQYLGALDETDRKIIKDLSGIRNDLAHELFKVISDEGYPELEKAIIDVVISQYHKVANWWICNFEAAIDPEQYQHFDEIEMSSATSTQVTILAMLSGKI